MKNMEQELKKALGRKDPGPDFAERVMARIRSESAVGHAADSRARVPIWRAWFRMPALRWAGAAAFCLMLAVAGLLEYRARELRRRQEGEMARRQVILALRIASAKLNGALREVKQVDRAPREPSATRM